MAKAVVRQGKVLMLDEAGDPVAVDKAQLQQAYAAGYSLETPEAVQARELEAKRGTLGQQAIAGLEGAARGATLGLSDVAGRELLGPEYTQAAAERQQVNPITSTVGEVGGAVAPILASGGTSLGARGLAAIGTPARVVARAGTAVERGVASGLARMGAEGSSILGRMGARGVALGAAGATEGAAYGAGKALSDTVLQGDDLTVEKLLAAAGEGAEMGGVAGGALGALGGGLGGVLQRVASAEKVQRGLEKMAEFSAFKAAGARGSDFKKLVARRGEGAPEAVGRELLDYEFKTGPKAGQKIFRAATKAEDLVDDISYARREVGEQIGAIRQQVDELGQARRELMPDVDEYLNRVQREVLEPLKRSNVTSIRQRAARVEGELEKLRAMERSPGTVRSADSWLDEMSAAGVSVEGTPEWAARAVKNTFGDAAPSASKLRQLFDVPEGFRTELRVVPQDRSVEVWFDIFSDQGGIAGSGMRKFGNFYDDGQLRAIHDHLYLQPAAQGQGIGSRLMANAREIYPELGVTKIRIPRASEIGRYAWARQGAELDPGDLAAMRGKFRDFAFSRGEFVDEANMSLKDIADHPLGKEFLTGTEAPKYEASIALTPNPTPSRVVPGDRRMSFAELEATRRELRNVFDPPRKQGLPPPIPEHAEALEQSERVLDSYLDEITQKALRSTGDDVGTYINLQKQYANLKDADRIASQAALQQAGNRALSPSDYATGFGMGLGALLSGNIGGLAYGAAGAVAHKLIRERGRSTLAVLADRASKMDLRMDDFAKRLAGVKKGSFAAVTKTASSLGDYDDAAKAVEEVTANPRVLAKALEQSTAGMEEHTGLVLGIHQLIQGDLAYLKQQLPTKVTRASSSMTPTVENVRVTTRDKKRWLEKRDALANPLGVIEQLAKGEVPVDAIDALKERRPKLWMELRDRIMVATAEREEPLPYRKRITIGMVFQFPADASLTPTMMESIQMTHETSVAPEQPGPRPTGKLSSEKLSTEMMTTTQRIAAGA